jgi:integrase
MATRLTDAVIRHLPLPVKGARIWYDGEVGGLGVRVTAKGASSFVLNYRTRSGRERRYTIGATADWTTTAARAEARRLRHLISEGGDPLAELEAERAAPTMVELIDRFEAEHLPRRRESTAADYRKTLSKHIRPHFGAHTRVADVSFADIDALHRKVTVAGYPYAANRAISILSKMFNLAIRWRMRSDNPAKGVERNAEHHRRRYLSGAELDRLTKALAEYPDRQAVDAIRVLLMTGCRKGEALGMRWVDLDLTAGVWTKPPTSTKQGREHEVPLAAPVRQLLSEIQKSQNTPGTFVFPGPGRSGHLTTLQKPWARICKAAGITGLRPHDLRHSFASQLVSGGASLPLIGALLGHSNPATTHRYAHLFDDPQRAAVEKVAAIVTGAPAAEVMPGPWKRS